MPDNPIFRDKLARLIEMEREAAELRRALESRDETPRIAPFAPQDPEVWALLARFGSDFLSIHSPSGAYRFASPSVRGLFGWDPGDLLGTSAYNDFHPDDAKEIAENHEGHVDPDPVEPIEYRFRCADGSYRWVETRSRASFPSARGATPFATTRGVGARWRSTWKSTSGCRCPTGSVRSASPGTSGRRPHPPFATPFQSRGQENRMIHGEGAAGNSPRLYLNTGQAHCYDTRGRKIACRGTGQDGELAMGVPWPEPRFQEAGKAVLDRLTGLVWTRNADLAGRWTTWEEAFRVVNELNQEKGGGRSSWVLPTINELESLVDASRHTPALPADHPFTGVQEAYWSSTSSGFEPDWCMALYMLKGAVGVGQKKDKNFSVWAVSREE